ncbi:MAG: multiheme c-type cytochrome [Oligoflexia bacterium]|nr:multiheme c-type cytochrome [Oligoflexia bacterium]
MLLALLLTLANIAMPQAARADVLIVHSNDVLGEIEPCGCRSNPLGGMARKANLLKKLEQANEVVQLDAGDLLFPSDSLPPMLEKQSELQAKFLLSAMDQLHHDAIVPGEKDFALGWKTFQKLRAGSKAKFLAANLYLSKSNSPALAPYAIFERKNRDGKKIRVAVIGLVGEDLKWPKELKASPAIAAAKREVHALEGKADLIVALTHEGLEADRALAQAVPGIDIIIGGHTQSFLQNPLVIGKARIYQSSFRNQYIGVLPAKKPFNGEGYELVGLDPAYDSPAEKPSQTDRLVQEFKAGIAKFNLTEVAQQTETKAPQAPAGSAPKFQTWVRCAECHTEQFDFWRRTPHARALSPLVKAGQSANKECLSCHTVGLGDPEGLLDISKLATLRGDKAISTPELNTFLESMTQAKSMDAPVTLTPLDPPMPLNQAISRIDRSWTPVQCENCHKGSQDHPFSNPMSEKVVVTTCVQCHTAERAPAWYTKDGKLDEKIAAEKKAKIACPASN